MNDEERSKVIQSTAEFIGNTFYNTMERLAEGAQNIIPLSVDEIEALHTYMVNRFGGTLEVRDVALLESVAIAPFQSVFGQDLYPTIFDKAAKYLLDFSRYQIFADGNKRMGLATAERFLLMNDMELDVTEEQAYNLVIDIAIGKITELEEVSEFIKNHYKFLENPGLFPPETSEEINSLEEHDDEH